MEALGPVLGIRNIKKKLLGTPWDPKPSRSAFGHHFNAKGPHNEIIGVLLGAKGRSLAPIGRPKARRLGLGRNMVPFWTTCVVIRVSNIYDGASESSPKR